MFFFVKEFFKEQIEKHSRTVSLIEQNLAAQTNILRALTDANAKFARVRKENAEIAKKSAQLMHFSHSFLAIPFNQKPVE